MRQRKLAVISRWSASCHHQLTDNIPTAPERSQHGDSTHPGSQNLDSLDVRYPLQSLRDELH